MALWIFILKFDILNTYRTPTLQLSLLSVLGKTAEKELLPMQPGDVQKTYAGRPACRQAGVQDLIDDFDYKPNTPLEKGIGEFVKWFFSYKKLEV